MLVYLVFQKEKPYFHTEIFTWLNILQAAESGNLEEFIRLYQFDNQRLFVKDVKGRQVAHQAAARNKVNILQFIQEQGGGKRFEKL